MASGTMRTTALSLIADLRGSHERANAPLAVSMTNEGVTELSTDPSQGHQGASPEGRTVLG